MMPTQVYAISRLTSVFRLLQSVNVIILLKNNVFIMPLRKLSKCQQILQETIYNVAKELKLTNIEYTVLFGSEDIDSFYTDLFNVEISGHREGHRIKHEVIIKWHSDRKTSSTLREAYVREITFYTKIVPRYLEIQKRFNVVEGLRIKFPNCIFSSDEYGKETVVVMNVVGAGYVTRDRFLETDLDSVAIVMKYLGKFHALSFVFEKCVPEEFELIKRIYDKDAQHSDPNRECGSIKCYYEASVDAVSDPVARRKLKELTPHILSILHKSTLPVPEYSAICHADCWNNNILYKNKGQKPVEVLFIDYQVTRYASPVTDIAYFLYMSSVGKDFLSKHYDSLIDIYYATLTAVLRECYMKVEEIYPRKVFEKHLEEYSVFGLIEALISMMIITAPTEEALKMTEIKDQLCDERFIESHSNNYFKCRVNNIVDHFVSKNYSLNAVLYK